jgi:hypothetical protein
MTPTASLWMVARDARGRIASMTLVKTLGALRAAARRAVQDQLACPACGAPRDLFPPTRPGNPAVLLCDRPTRDCCEPQFVPAAVARLWSALVPECDAARRLAIATARERCDAARFPLFHQ